MLSILARVNGVVIALRNYLYDKGIFEVHDLGAPTISVGNITVGGTGKTPLVAYVTNVLADRGEKVCILTRGYGRRNESEHVLVSDGERILADAATGGDEPVELANKLLGKAIVISDADRVAAAEWAKRKFGITAFVLDDGFQHRKVKRDVDIVCVDATEPFGREMMLPAGRLREPLAGLSRADTVVVTRVEQAGDILDLKLRISDLAPTARVVECQTQVDGFVTLDGTSSKPYGSAFAFCAIGNPDSFFTVLEKAGVSLRGTHAFRDHHGYSQNDVRTVEELANAAGANRLVTTAKDAVKVRGFDFTLPCDVLEVALEFDTELL